MSGLFGSTALEVAIGLFFVYWVLSLICSSINEHLAGFFKLRARDLDRGIRNLLCDPTLAHDVLNHPRIKALGSTRAETAPVEASAGQGTDAQGKGADRPAPSAPSTRGYFAARPSYIPSRTFTAALFDVLAPTTSGEPVTVDRIRRKALAYANAAEQEKQAIGKNLLTLIDESRDPQKTLLTVADVNQMVDRLSDESSKQEIKGAIAGADTLDAVRKQISLLPYSPARNGILRAIDEGQVHLETLRTNVETWYDNAMDRVRGVYKRRTQWWLLVISALVVFAVGADTLQIYNSLATNPPLRAAIVAEAGKAGSSPGAPASDVSKLVAQLNQANLPFGYGGGPKLDLSSSAWWKWLVEKLLGLFVTTFAVALGAPFWFDVLQKVANIRAAGPRPT